MSGNSTTDMHKGLKPASPYHNTIHRDVPHVVFETVHNMILAICPVVQTRSTRAVTSISISSRSTLEVLFLQGGIKVPLGELTEKSNSKGTFKVLFENSPFSIKYHKTTERLVISYMYGHWNIFQVPQHFQQ